VNASKSPVLRTRHRAQLGGEAALDRSDGDDHVLLDELGQVEVAQRAHQQPRLALVGASPHSLAAAMWLLSKRLASGCSGPPAGGATP